MVSGVGLKACASTDLVFLFVPAGPGGGELFLAGTALLEWAWVAGEVPHLPDRHAVVVDWRGGTLVKEMFVA